MSINTINYINILLMLVSAALSYVFPFEVFLGAYAILGPLHYLTEISWLEKGNFYIKNKQEIWWLVILSFAIVASIYGLKRWNGYGADITYIAFFSALAFTFIRTATNRLAAIAIILASVLLFNGSYFQFIIFGVFLPTLIHVFLFTGAFILYGALKGKSLSGYLSLAAFALLGTMFFWAGTDLPIQITAYGKEVYNGIFRQMNEAMLQFFNQGNSPSGDDSFFYSSPQSIALMRFIAFAYIYHYLNWFSKTKVIKWHETTKWRLALVSALWIGSVILYMLSYELGLKYLYLLSILHVFLEFPLNFHTFKGIGKEIANRFRPSPSS
jgi:hypothetical protein